MPDILLIILDTQRRDRLSLYGHNHLTSPHLDEFAAQATVFERAIAPAQWTVPSHASMFTGVYPSTHQVTQANGQLSGMFPTLAEMLQLEGYHTAGFCNNPLVGVLNNGLQRGFTDFYNYAGAAPNRPLDVQKSGVRKALSKQWRRFAQAVSNQFALSDWLFRVSLNPRLTPVWTRYINYKGHTQHSIDDLMGYIQQQRTHKQPYFAFLNLMGTHLPYRPPQQYLKPLDKHAYRIMNRFNADAVRWASPVDPPFSAEEGHIIDTFYDAEIAHQDYHLGRLLRYVQGLDDTMVIIAADHGEGHGDHEFFGHSFVVYQELVHVPLIIHYPQMFPAGQRLKTNISTRRIFHTVLDAVGQDSQGLSLANSINGQADSEGGLVFAEAVPPHTLINAIQHRNPALLDKHQLMQVRRGVYHGDHKLAMVGEQVEGLFEIDRDPAELRDVAPQNSATVSQLQHHLANFVQENHRTDDVASSEVSADVVENLRALGYFE